MNQARIWNTLSWMILLITASAYIFNLIEFENAVVFMFVLISTMVGWLHD